MKKNVFFKGIFLLLFVLGNIVLTDAGTTSEDRRGGFYVKWPYPHVPKITPTDDQLKVTSTQTAGVNTSLYTNAKVLGIYFIECGDCVEEIMIPYPPYFPIVTFEKVNAE